MTSPASPASPDRAASVYIGAFVDELARSGVRNVCVAPGSRSTPLALTIAAHPALRTWMHLDERSAAFFALGLARMTATPVALLCTSGTATANFLPAVVEARAAGVPLLVLTADRPPELRDVGAAQTINQAHLYGAHVKWFVDVALPEATSELLRYVRTLACRATALASAAPAGPVHLNFPLREPLVPVPVDAPARMSEADALAWHGRANGAPWVSVDDPPPAADAVTVTQLADVLRTSTRPLFVCGPQPDPDLAASLSELARRIDAPVLADPLSQLRWGAHDHCAIIARYDATLRDETMAAALVPNVIVRIGAIPTSKPLLQYMQRHATVRQIVIDAARWPDPLHTATEMVHADPRVVCDQLRTEFRTALLRASFADNRDWLATWRRIDAAADRALCSYVDSLGAEPFDGRALADVAAALPSGGTLMVSSSMPVRDLDSFARGDSRALRVLANRGANGIDGVISTALGAAAAARDAGGAPLVLVVGDLAFYHDMNGLLAAKLHALDATIVVINNDGGGIFSFLPQATQADHFEQLFGTPHGLDFAPAAAMYGAQYTRAESHEALRDAVSAGIGGHGLHIVELRTDRARNVALHRDAWRAVADALEAMRESA